MIESSARQESYKEGLAPTIEEAHNSDMPMSLCVPIISSNCAICCVVGGGWSACELVSLVDASLIDQAEFLSRVDS